MNNVTEIRRLNKLDELVADWTFVERREGILASNGQTVYFYVWTKQDVRLAINFDSTLHLRWASLTKPNGKLLDYMETWSLLLDGITHINLTCKEQS